MRFTVAALHKRLGKLIDEGHGRKIVCIDKSSFQHNLEADGCVILEVSGLGVKWIPTMDGDGGMAYRINGTEAGRTVLVLAGDCGANMDGDLVNPVSGTYTRDEADRRLTPELKEMSYAWAAGEWLAGRITTEQMRETFENLQRTGG